jgi:flagella basal body P-ring formation protein FlgA
MMNNSGQPLSMRKKIKILIALTLLAWATQTLFHQWGYGQEMPIELARQTFVPQTITAGAGTMELRNDATVLGDEIKLKQICRWSDADASAFMPVADLIIARFNKNIPTRSIALDDLRGTLRDAGVNLAVIRFAGTTACTVTRGDFANGERAALQQWIDERTAAAAAPAPATQPVAHEADADAAVRSLRAMLLTDLSQRLNLPVERLQVSFDPKDTNLLNLSEPNFHFDIQPRRVRDLGEVSWTVSIVTDAATSARQKVTVVANARAWQEQVIIARPVTCRGVIRDEDVTERRVLIDHIDETPVLNKSQVVSQEAARDLQMGTVMTARLVESVPLAKPGQYVTVMLNQGSVQIKTVAKAMEAGSFGQSIRVKNEATREMFEVTLTGPQLAMMGTVHE